MKADNLSVIVMIMLLGVAVLPIVQATTCNFLGTSLCAITPCPFLNSVLWSSPLGPTSEVIVKPFVDAKFWLSTSVTLNSLECGGGSGTVTLDIKAGATLTINDDLKLAAGSVLNVYGNVKVNGIASIAGTINVFAGASIDLASDVDVAAGAVLNINAGVVTCLSGLNVRLGASVSVGIAAQLNMKAGAAVNGQVTLRGKITADSTITVNGALRAYANARLQVNVGSIVVSVGAVVSLQGAICEGVDVKVSGTLDLSLAAQVTLSDALIVLIDGKVTVGSNCVLNVGLASTIVGKLDIAGSASVTLSEEVTVNGTLSVGVSSSLTLNGKLTANANAVVSLNGALCNIRGIATIRGSLFLNLNAQARLATGIVIDAKAAVQVAAGCSLVLLANSQIHGKLLVTQSATLEIAAGLTTCTTPLSINGTLILRAALRIGANAYVQRYGVLNLIDAKASLTASTITVSESASIVGSGKLVAASVTIAGICDVLSLNITGALFCNPTSNIIAHVSGLYAHTKILVTGKVTLGGNLSAKLENGFCPSALNTVYRIIKCASVVGSLSNFVCSPAVLEARVLPAAVSLVSTATTCM